MARGDGVAQRREPVRKVRVFDQQRLDLRRAGRGPRHIADQMHDGVAMADIDVQLVQRVAAKALEVLLDFDLDVVALQVAREFVAVEAKFVRDGGQEDGDRHARGAVGNASVSHVSRRGAIPARRTRP